MALKCLLMPAEVIINLGSSIYVWMRSRVLLSFAEVFISTVIIKGAMVVVCIMVIIFYFDFFSKCKKKFLFISSFFSIHLLSSFSDSEFDF